MSPAFVREFTGHKRPVTRIMFPFNDVIMDACVHERQYESPVSYCVHSQN